MKFSNQTRVESAMPKMIVSIDGVVIKEVQLTKDRTSLGRRPYNDIVIDNLAVSGEHAVLQISGHEVYLEDLNSTNGTYVNGGAVKKQLLQSNDLIEIGKYKIKYVNDSTPTDSEQSILTKASSTVNFTANSDLNANVVGAAIKVMSGPAAGREVALIKIVTTIGKPGVGVAAITKRHQEFVIAHIEGTDRPYVNGALISSEPVILNHGDILELAGIRMQFLLL